MTSGPDQTAPNRPGLLTPDQIDELVEGIHTRTNGASAQATGAAASNLDLYQVNSTFYDALGRDDARYLAAQATQLFTPEIPQIYYVGALVGHNDTALLNRTHVGRDINRHHYTDEEVASNLQRPVVAALLWLCRFRNQFPAFDGALEVDVDGSRLRMVRRGQLHNVSATLEVDLSTGNAEITATTDAQDRHFVNLLTQARDCTFNGVTPIKEVHDE